MKRLLVMAIFALVFITTSAQAADKGMYVSGIAGLSLVPELDQEISGTRVFETDFDPGIKIAGALGYDFGTLRAEVEIGYLTNEANDGMGFGGSGPVEGDVSVLSFMVNGYYDIHTPNFSLVPYLGVGIGGASIDAIIIVPLLAPSTQVVVDDSATVFAYQFMAGFGWNVSPTITLTADYRYFATTDPAFTPGNAFSGSPDLESDYNNHSFNLGARFKF